MKVLTWKLSKINNLFIWRKRVKNFEYLEEDRNYVKTSKNAKKRIKISNLKNVDKFIECRNSSIWELSKL